MKLHLPVSLRFALLACVCVGVSHAAEKTYTNTWTAVGSGNEITADNKRLTHNDVNQNNNLIVISASGVSGYIWPNVESINSASTSYAGSGAFKFDMQLDGDIRITNANSNSQTQFVGAFSGKGDFTINKNLTGLSFRFDGDMSEYYGNISNISGNSSHHLTFAPANGGTLSAASVSSSSSEVNFGGVSSDYDAEFEGSTWDAYKTTLTSTYTVKSNVTAKTLNIYGSGADANVVFAAHQAEAVEDSGATQLNATTANIVSGKGTIQGQATITTLNVSGGALVLGDTGTLEATTATISAGSASFGGQASIGTVTVSGGNFLVGRAESATAEASHNGTATVTTLNVTSGSATVGSGATLTIVQALNIAENETLDVAGTLALGDGFFGAEDGVGNLGTGAIHMVGGKLQLGEYLTAGDFEVGKLTWSDDSILSTYINSLILGISNRQTASYDESTGVVTISAGEGSQSLLWSGNSNDSWSGNVWQNAENGNPIDFMNGDSVTFGTEGATPAAATTVVLDHSVQVADITVRDSEELAGYDYNFEIARNEHYSLGFSGNFSGGFNKTGEGTLAMSSENASAAHILIEAGTLEIEDAFSATADFSHVSSAAAGTLSLATSGDSAGVTLADSFAGKVHLREGTLLLTSSSLGNVALLELAGGNLKLDNAEAYSFTQAIAGPGTITKAGNGTATLSSVSGFTGNYVVQGGVLDIVVAAGDSLEIASNISATGSASFSKSGAGSLLFSGSTTNGSHITVADGTMEIGATTALNGVSYRVESGAFLDLKGYDNGGNTWSLTLNGGTLTSSSSAGGMSTGHKGLASITLEDDSVIDTDSRINMINSNYNASTLNLGGHTLEKTGADTLYLGNAHLATGTTGTIKVSEGTLEIYSGQAGATRSNINGVAVEVQSGATLKYTSVPSGSDVIEHEVSRLTSSGSGAANVELDARSMLKITAAQAGDTFSGTLKGSGKLVMAGGELTLAGLSGAQGSTATFELAGGTLTLSNGQEYFANVGAINLAGGTLKSQAGWWTNKAVTIGNLTIEGGAYNATFLGSANTVSGTITNKLTGQQNANENIYRGLQLKGTLTLASLDALETRDSYSDGENGYFRTDHLLIKSGADNAAFVISKQITVGETVYDISTDAADKGIVTDNGTEYLRGTGSAYIAGTQGTDYIVRVGEVRYELGAEGNTISQEQTTGIVLDGGSLDMVTNLRDGVGITAEQNATIELGSAVTLSGSSLTKVGTPTVTLTGSGTYEVTQYTDLAKVTGYTGEDWTGTVHLNGVSQTSSILDLSQYGNEGSTIKLTGYTGHYKVYGSVAADLVLANGTEGHAIKFSNGSSQSGATQVFSGSVSGNGSFVRAWTSGTAISFKFSGDVSAWEGAFRNENTSGTATGLTFDGHDAADANKLTVKATLGNSGGSVKDLNVTFDSKDNENMVIDVQSVIEGNAKVTYQGSGTAEVSGASTYTKGTDINGGMVKVMAAGALGTGAININNTGKLSAAVASALGAVTVNVNNGGTLTAGIADALSSSTVDVKSGGTLNATATGALGTANVAVAGTLNVQAANALGTTALTVVSGGELYVGNRNSNDSYNQTTESTVTLEGGSVTIKKSQLHGGIVLNTTGDAASTVTGADGALWADVSGTGNLELKAEGELHVYSDASFTGDLELSAGTVNLGHTASGSSAANIHNTGDINVTGAAVNVRYNGETGTTIANTGALNISAGSVDVENHAVLKNDGNITVSGAGALTIENGGSIAKGDHDTAGTGIVDVQGGSMTVQEGGSVSRDITVSGEGKLTVNSGATITGAVNAGNLTIAKGATYSNVEVTATTLVGITGLEANLNNAVIELKGETYSITGVQLQNSTVSISDGTLTLDATALEGIKQLNVAADASVTHAGGGSVTMKDSAVSVALGADGGLAVESGTVEGTTYTLVATEQLSGMVLNQDSRITLTLTGDIEEMLLGTQSVALQFDGLVKAEVGQTLYSVGSSTSADGIFTLTGDGYEIADVVYNPGNTMVYISAAGQPGDPGAIPEPTSATLSLLALAALAVRRRRK